MEISDISKDEKFNEMMGFTVEEIITLLEHQNVSKKTQGTILPIMKENYDGYNFSVYAKNNIYNSNMCLFFLKDLVRLGKILDQLIDMNIASDYAKLDRMLDLYQGERRKEIIEKTVSGENIISELTEKFNPAIDFTEKCNRPPSISFHKKENLNIIIP